MADSSGSITLGGVTFEGFAAPEELLLGGTQKMRVHEVLGGKRVDDAMGASPEPISWTGRFLGADALTRAKTLDAMRQAGAQHALSWNGLYYTVVIASFRFKAAKFHDVSFEIALQVVDDPASAATSTATGSSLDKLIGADLKPLTSLVGGAADPLQKAVSLAGTLQGAASGRLGPVLSAASSLSTSLGLNIGSADAQIGKAIGIARDVSSLVSHVKGQSSAIQTVSTLLQGKALVDRIAVNLGSGMF